MQGWLGLPDSQALQGHGLLWALLRRFGAGLALCCARPCPSWATPWTAWHGPANTTEPDPTKLARPAAKLGQALAWSMRHRTTVRHPI
eukprot:10548859-Alexandrium_andersonii.AAC.1